MFPVSVDLQVNKRTCSLQNSRDLPDAPYEVVRETLEGEEDKFYPAHAKVPQPNGPDLPI